MKYLKKFEMINDDYTIYYKRFNDPTDDIIKNIDILESNKIEYDVYIMTHTNNNSYIIYAYSKIFDEKFFDNDKNFNYSPTLTSLYGELPLDEIRYKIKIANSSSDDNISWNIISKDDLILKLATNKFNL